MAQLVEDFFICLFYLFIYRRIFRVASTEIVWIVHSRDNSEGDGEMLTGLGKWIKNESFYRWWLDRSRTHEPSDY